MQYTFYFLIIIPISYNKCWKCPPLRSSQRSTRRIMLASTFYNVPVDILSTVSWMLAWSSCSVCVDDLNTQYPWDSPIKRSLGGLSPGIVEATISLKWGIQETQIPSKPWVAWLFEHSVFSGLLTNVIKMMKATTSNSRHIRTDFIKICTKYECNTNYNLNTEELKQR
jgi:hypothetical protein